MKHLYVVDDVRGSINEDVAISFWSTEPTGPLRGIVSKTEDYVLDALGLPMELDQGTGRPLQRGEELLIRAVPNRSGGNEADLYLNVTSVAIREPTRRISKGELRGEGDCPRETYLRYVKNVYTGGHFNRPPYQRSALFRGDAVHKIAELALEKHPERFEEDSWNEDTVSEFCETVFEGEFGFRQALLVLSGAGLQARDYVIENVTNLFTDDDFSARLREANNIVTEEFLDERYGFGGRVDILLDGVPYDLKTTRNPDDNDVRKHSYQLKLYLFVLLLESIEDGVSIAEAVADNPEGMLVYPNTTSSDVRIEPVEITTEDISEFLELRNEIASGGESFAPPSTYNRNCDGCQYAVEEWITGEDDALPPACTFHCQNERRWPCYEIDDGFHTECSRFDDCDQRLEYRDPEGIAYYDRTRKALRSERRSRRTATQLLEQFDPALLTSAGYHLPNLQFSGVDGAGTILRFESASSVVPAFNSGETVRLESTSGSIAVESTYYGREGDEFLFKKNADISVGEVLSEDSTFEATYRFSTESVDNRFLPYLDFAQRSGIDPGFGEANLGESVELMLEEPSDIIECLDNKEIFVDIPVQKQRTEEVSLIVRELLTAEYPKPSAPNETIRSEASRSLVIGANSQLVETAVDGQPTGNHYQLDGTGGGDSVISEEDGYHSIQTRLDKARSIVTSSQLVMSQNGPGGITDFFHKLDQGDYKNGDDPSKRDHSENFFDLLIILGGEKFTEPEYHFLAELADRVVTVGDTRRTGPAMVSAEGKTAGLEESYFEQAYDHYSSFPDPQVRSIQTRGDAPPALQKLYTSGPWRELDGNVEFLNIEGTEEIAVETVELTTTIRCEHAARRLVFDVTDTPVNPVAAQELFYDRTSLDATKLEADSVVLIDEQTLYLEEISDIEGESTNDHEVVIKAEASELPQFSRAVITNTVAERIVSQVVKERSIDLVVTPFESHAANIREQSENAEKQIPICRPEELSGDIVDNVVVSLPLSNEQNIVRPPLDDPEVLYDLLSSGTNMILVGHGSTLKTKDLFKKLIESAEEYQ